ncbi:hypothetical protein FSARC_14549, partial [Fusarium sarcochroum]
MEEQNPPSDYEAAATKEPDSIHTPNLSAVVIRRIYNQMVSEIFKLAGRDPHDHPECFAACVLKVDSTEVIRASDFTTWGNHPLLAGELDQFNRANKAGRSNVFYMIPATTAVTIAAVLNQKYINVDSCDISSAMNLFSKSNVWAYLGTAIDVWPQLADTQFLVKQHEKSSERPVVGKGAFGKVCVHTSEFDRITPLMLLSMARINGWVKPVPGASWLKKDAVDCEQIIHRRKALNDGKKVIEKLGNRKFKQDDKIFMRGMRAWLSEPVIRVLPDDIKNPISASEEDLKKWKFMGKTEGTVASLISHDIDWQDLAHKVQDGKSTEAIKTVVEFAEKVRAIHQTRRNYISDAAPGLMEVRKTLLEQQSDCPPLQQVFGSALNQCFLSQETDGRKNILIGALQRLFDNIVYVVSRSHALCSAFLDLASKADATIIPCLDLDVARAKARHQQRLKSNEELAWRNERVADIAKEVNSLEPGSTSPDSILRSRINLILDLADATILLESLPREVRIVVRSRSGDEEDPDV